MNKINSKEGGFVYVLINPAFPGSYRIDHPSNIAPPSSTTTSPWPYACEYKVFVPDYMTLVKAIHEHLDRYRLNQSKEYFQCDFGHIINVIKVAYYEVFGKTYSENEERNLPAEPERLLNPSGELDSVSESVARLPFAAEAKAHGKPLTLAPIDEILKTYFGFSDFRPGQRKVVEQILAQKSSAAVFPTGAGKSLCYQLPALLMPGLTLVISPLIALMKDQIDALLSKDIHAARLDSTLSNNEYQDVMRRVRGGTIKILYVAPERFMNERFRAAMKGIPISLFAVDESHCISEWGHNFRPDYLKLPLFAEAFKADCILALTATATPEVLKDICKSFHIEPAHAQCTGFYRSNLTLLTCPVEASKRDDHLLSELGKRPQGPTIIYVTQQKTAEKVSRMLVENGLQSRFYHAGMVIDDRTAIQDWFISCESGIVVATIAFGMGIDKSNIRYVFHYNLPKSMENYSQEIGRAGRDGLPAICKVFACPDDLNTLENFVYGDTPTLSAIQGLMAFIFSQENSFHLSLLETATTFDIRSIVLSTLMTYLELKGLIQADTPFYADYQFKKIVSWIDILEPLSEDRKDFLNGLLAYTKNNRVWSHIDIDAAVGGLATSRERIVSALNYLAEKQFIELKVASLRTPYRIIQKPGDVGALAQNIHETMIIREKKEIDRLNNMLEWTTLKECQTRALGRYFGECSDVPCGHCSACRNEQNDPVPMRKQTPPDILDKVLQQARGLQALHADLKIDSMTMTRFLCGISSPRLVRTKLASSHPMFGILADTPFSQVLLRLKEIL